LQIQFFPAAAILISPQLPHTIDLLSQGGDVGLLLRERGPLLLLHLLKVVELLNKRDILLRLRLDRALSVAQLLVVDFVHLEDVLLKDVNLLRHVVDLAGVRDLLPVFDLEDVLLVELMQPLLPENRMVLGGAGIDVRVDLLQLLLLLVNGLLAQLGLLQLEI